MYRVSSTTVANCTHHRYIENIRFILFYFLYSDDTQKTEMQEKIKETIIIIINFRKKYINDN